MAGGRLLAFFQNFGSGELIVILLVALVVVGPDRLPDLARSLGKGLHKLRTMTDGMSSQVQDIVDDPAMAPLRELGEFAARPRQKLAEYALEAEAEERFRQEQPSPSTDTASPDTAVAAGDTAVPAGDTAVPAGDTAIPVSDAADPSVDAVGPVAAADTSVSDDAEPPASATTDPLDVATVRAEQVGPDVTAADPVVPAAPRAETEAG